MTDAAVIASRLEDLRRRHEEIRDDIQKGEERTQKAIQDSSDRAHIAIEALGAEVRILAGQALDRRVTNVENNLRWIVRAMVGALLSFAASAAVYVVMTQGHR